MLAVLRLFNNKFYLAAQILKKNALELLKVGLKYVDRPTFTTIAETDIGKWSYLDKRFLLPLALKHPDIYLKLLEKAMRSEVLQERWLSRELFIKLLRRLSMEDPETAYKQLMLSLQLNFLQHLSYDDLWRYSRFKKATKLVFTLTFLTQHCSQHLYQYRYHCFTNSIRIFDDTKKRVTFNLVQSIRNLSDEHLELYFKLAIDALLAINASGINSGSNINPERSPEK